MSNTVETVKVRSANAPNGYMVINKADFDPATHEPHDDKGSRASSPAPAKPQVQSGPGAKATITGATAEKPAVG